MLLCDPERVRTRAHDLVATSEEFLAASWAAAATGGTAPIDLGAAAFHSLGDVRSVAGELGLPWWTVSPFAAAPGTTPERNDDRYDTVLPVIAEIEDTRSLTVGARPVDAYRGETARAVSDIAAHTRDGWRTVLVFEGHGPAQRAVEVLADAEVGATLAATVDAPPAAGTVTVTTGRLGNGFLVESAEARGHHRDRPHRRPRGLHEGHAADAVAPAQRGRPAAAACPATSWCTSSTASASTSR